MTQNMIFDYADNKGTDSVIAVVKKTLAQHNKSNKV